MPSFSFAGIALYAFSVALAWFIYESLGIDWKCIGDYEYFQGSLRHRRPDGDHGPQEIIDWEHRASGQAPTPCEAKSA